MSSKPSIAFYNILLRRPALLGDGEVSLYTSLFSGECVAASASRENRSHKGDWVISWLFEQKPSISWLTERAKEQLPQAGLGDGDWQLEAIPDDIDWLARSYQGFQPFAVEGFYIYGSHYEGAVPEGLTGLQIDAATAFGSGEHGTTAGCIRLMSGLRAQGFAPEHVLDMGTGSGILAVAAVKLWDAPVLAVDIEEESVRVTRNHAALNNVAEKITALQGDGFATGQVQEQAPYDLVIANILAAPLIDMAAALCKVVAPGGYVILSGMLDEQAESVRTVYEGCLVESVKAHSEGGWTSLLLQKPL